MAQQNGYIHPTTFQLFYSSSDFRHSSVFSGLSNGYGGLGVSLTKGINPRIDWGATVDFLYADSVMKRKQTLSSKQLLVETDLSLRWRFLNPSAFFQPFLSGGLGVSVFDSYWGGYVYPGAGIQLNISTEAFLLLNVQRRFGLTNTLANHYFYSIGLAGNIGKRKQKSKPKAKARTNTTAQISPDRDKDGILDSVDVCPDQPGLAVYHGCPDSDQDGIPDNLDKCPIVPGFAKYQGCPIPDTDGDGINDEEDQCVTVPGVVRYRGCPIPDTDKDGVNDEEDSCIVLPGPREFHGCPEIKKEIKEAVDLAARNIFFKTGSYELLNSSFPALDTVARILREHPELKLQIEGHTDNVGTFESNKKLSENRAQSILNYLTKKGIDLSKLSAVGFGEEKPISDNQTAKGRALNRRVELKLSLPK